MNDPRMRRMPVFSLRELFMLVAFFAAGFTALKFATTILWAIIFGWALLTFMAIAVIALLDRGPRQAFAIGFVVYGGIYFGLVAGSFARHSNSGPNPELDPYEGRLPTTILLKPLFEAVVEQKRVNPSPSQSANNSPFSLSVGALLMESPDREDFTAIGHCLWGLLLAYVGGRFGQYVYWRRMGRASAGDDST